MKKLKAFIFILLAIFLINGCSLFQSEKYPDSAEVNSLKEEGRYVVLDYATYQTMCFENKTFLLYLKSKTCYQCHLIQDEYVEILNEDKDKVLYVLVYEDLNEEQRAEFLKYSNELLGNKYYEDNDLKIESLYVPLSIQVINGKVTNLLLGFKSSSKLVYMYDFNYFTLRYYENVLYKVDKLDEVTIYCSSVTGDKENILDNYLRDYYKTHKEENGYYYNYANLSDIEKDSLLEQINNLLDDASKIEDLPPYFKICYKNKQLVTYEEINEVIKD